MSELAKRNHWFSAKKSLTCGDNASVRAGQSVQQLTSPFTRQDEASARWLDAGNGPSKKKKKKTVLEDRGTNFAGDLHAPTVSSGHASSWGDEAEARPLYCWNGNKTLVYCRPNLAPLATPPHLTQGTGACTCILSTHIDLVSSEGDDAEALSLNRSDVNQLLERVGRTGLLQNTE